MKKLRQCGKFEAFKLFLLFLMGGMLYYAIEIAYKGDSHVSMFIVGGISFIIIGGLNNYFDYNMPLIKQMLISSVVITALEFFCGCIVNIWLGLNVWDYSALPFNLLGQICLPFMFIWFFLSLAGIFLDDFFRWQMFGEEKPHYVIFRTKPDAAPLTQPIK